MLSRLNRNIHRAGLSCQADFASLEIWEEQDGEEEEECPDICTCAYITRNVLPITQSSTSHTAQGMLVAYGLSAAYCGPSCLIWDILKQFCCYATFAERN